MVFRNFNLYLLNSKNNSNFKLGNIFLTCLWLQQVIYCWKHFYKYFTRSFRVSTIFHTNSFPAMVCESFFFMMEIFNIKIQIWSCDAHFFMMLTFHEPSDLHVKYFTPLKWPYVQSFLVWFQFQKISWCSRKTLWSSQKLAPECIIFCQNVIFAFSMPRKNELRKIRNVEIFF